MILDAAQAVNTVVRTLLPTGSGPTKGVRVMLKYNMADYSHEEDDASYQGYLVLLFRCTFNYMTVWAAYSHSPKPAEFKFVGHHDSGWRGVVETEVRDLENRVKAGFQSSFGKSDSPCYYSTLDSVQGVEIEADDRTLFSVK
jgi:hypothetical protein